MEASDFLKALRSLVEQAWCCPRLPSLTVLVGWRCFSLVLGHCEVSLECLLLNRSKQFKNVQDPSSKHSLTGFPWLSHSFTGQADIASRMEERQKRLGGGDAAALMVCRWYPDGIPGVSGSIQGSFKGVVQCRSNQKRSRYNML